MINIFVHYAYYEEQFQTDIINGLISKYPIDRVIIPSEYPWKGITSEGKKLYIPYVSRYVESYNINDLIPLSRDFMEKFSEQELILMDLLVREVNSHVHGYEEGKRIILKYVQFWYHFFVKEDISFFFARYVGQNVSEYVMYAVAKTLNVPIIVCYGERWGDSLENIGLEIEKKYYELIEGEIGNIELNKKNEGYCQKHWEQKHTLVINSYSEKKEIANCVSAAKSTFSLTTIIKLYLYCGKYYLIGKKSCKPQYIIYAKEKVHYYNHLWPRAIKKYIVSKKNGAYNRMAQNPDYITPFIYYALQTEPEIAVTPLVGSFNNQILAIHILSYSAEKYGMEVYVKEHIYQPWRDREFYDQIKKFKNVRLIKTTVNTYEIINHAVATATFTGSCSLEGVMRGIPALIFASNEWRGLPGSFYVTDAKTCCESLEAILNGQYDISKEKIRAYFKAKELTALNTDRCIGNDYSNETQEEYERNVQEHVDFIGNAMKRNGLL